MLAKGDAYGVFQMEGSGMRDILAKLKPNRFEDLIALVALYRPGPMDDIPTYISVKNGQEKPDYLHPVAEGHPGGDLRHHGLPGAGDADRPGPVGLFAGRRRPAAPRHGQEDPVGDGRPARQLRRGRRQEQRRGSARLDDLRQGGEVRGLRLQQVPFRALRPGRLPDGVSQGQLSGRVLRRVDDARHGQRRQDRQFPPRAGAPADPAAAA